MFFFHFTLEFSTWNYHQSFDSHGVESEDEDDKEELRDKHVDKLLLALTEHSNLKSITR